MSRNGLFLISLGSVFILLSYLMSNPIYLIATGAVFIVFGIRMVRKELKLEKEKRP